MVVPMGSAVLCSAAVSFTKRHGILTLTKNSMIWQAGGAGGPVELEIDTSRMITLFSSKEGGAKVMLKVTVLSDPNTGPQVEENYSFTFTSGASNVSDREHFKKEMSPIIAANRDRIASARDTEGQNGGGGGGGEASNGVTANGQTYKVDSSKTKQRAADQGTNRLRKKVLLTNPELAALHRELVISAMISEAEFWEGREGLLMAAAADEGQRKGRSGEMVDPKPETGEDGEVTVKITPALIREIFEEYPAVLRAFNDNVPTPLDDQQFWTRYFQSKLFNRNRTTNRAAVNTVKDDDIFDQYLGEEDDDVEPKNLKEHEIYRLLDLAATQDDQHEVENQVDFTMRAGGQRASLPLMRRFNEHSERLLNQSLGSQVPRNRIALDPGDAGARNSYYDDIILEDLNDTTSSDRIMLNMQENHSSMEGANSGQSQNTMSQLDAAIVLKDFRERFSDWNPHLSEFDVNARAINESMSDMLGNIQQKAERGLREHTDKREFPESILRQCTTIQASANEFLRQFWSAILPPKANDISAAAMASPAQKAAKAQRMKEYLDKTETQVAGVLLAATKVGGNVVRVEAALDPVRAAVANAIGVYNARIGHK